MSSYGGNSAFQWTSVYDDDEFCHEVITCRVGSMQQVLEHRGRGVSRCRLRRTGVFPLPTGACGRCALPVREPVPELYLNPVANDWLRGMKIFSSLPFSPSRTPYRGSGVACWKTR